MSVFEGWLQLSVDHVVPGQAIAAGISADWVLDQTNLVACCRSCNDLFNRDPGVTTGSADAFFDLRDALFASRRARILERREPGRGWFMAQVAPRLQVPSS